MAKIKVAINGAGRIGRAFYKLASKNDDLEIQTKTIKIVEY